MSAHDFFPFGPETDRRPATAAGPWRVLPIEGAFELVYEDRSGTWTSRTLDARDLKLGPGRTILGGIDRARGGYRGFRVDRIRRLTDAQTGQRIEGGILDVLLGRAETQRRALAAAARGRREPGRRAA